MGDCIGEYAVYFRWVGWCPALSLGLWSLIKYWVVHYVITRWCNALTMGVALS